jgi:hypothetical protein
VAASKCADGENMKQSVAMAPEISCMKLKHRLAASCREISENRAGGDIFMPLQKSNINLA